MIRNLSKADIEGLASRFAYGKPDPNVRRAAHLTLKDFLTICKWKADRSFPHCERNSAADVEALTAAAFRSLDPKVQAKALCALHGVRLPTASAILHWGFKEGPIIDYRTWWTVFEQDRRREFLITDWLAFSDRMQAEARYYDVSLREIDKAAWQYSFENQPSRGLTL